jgi:hypothetical protein
LLVAPLLGEPAFGLVPADVLSPPPWNSGVIAARDTSPVPSDAISSMVPAV